MRCPSCNKFPAKNTDTDPEGELEITDDGQVSGDIRIVNTSECCGDELEETTFSVELDFSDDVNDHRTEKHKNGKTTSLSVTADISRTDESPATDRNGKTITNPRYRKRFYGIVVVATVTCDDCGEDIADETFTDSVQASGMDSLV